MGRTQHAGLGAIFFHVLSWCPPGDDSVEWRLNTPGLDLRSWSQTEALGGALEPGEFCKAELVKPG
jgi:hypothetical protein